MQTDLFAGQPDERWRRENCSTCVTWNGISDTITGGCSIMGARHRDAPACERWFGKEQLRASLYGRKAK